MDRDWQRIAAGLYSASPWPFLWASKRRWITRYSLHCGSATFGFVPNAYRGEVQSRERLTATQTTFLGQIPDFEALTNIDLRESAKTG
jgi:hypothetical protein